MHGQVFVTFRANENMSKVKDHETEFRFTIGLKFVVS